MTNQDPALLVMAHGTRSPAGVEQCLELVRRVSAMEPDLALGAGFIELAEPDLDTALDRLVATGARMVVGVPLVLLGAGHLKNDGPAALARGRSRHRSTHLAYGRDLGIHPLVLSVAEDRIRSALEALGAGRPPGRDTAVVLVGRGSTDPDANSDLFKVARLLEESRGLGAIEASFVSLAPPSVPETLERCLKLGARRLAVVPYFLFTGRLVERIESQALAWARAHPQTSVAVGQVIGPDDRVAELVLERYGEAAAGGALMNCDCCVYRAPMPGYEERAGQPLEWTSST